MLLWLGRVVRSLTAMTARCGIQLGGDMWSLTFPGERCANIRREKWYWGVLIKENVLLFFLFEDVR